MELDGRHRSLGRTVADHAPRGLVGHRARRLGSPWESCLAGLPVKNACRNHAQERLSSSRLSRRHAPSDSTHCYRKAIFHQTFCFGILLFRKSTSAVLPPPFPSFAWTTPASTHRMRRLQRQVRAGPEIVRSFSIPSAHPRSGATSTWFLQLLSSRPFSGLSGIAQVIPVVPHYWRLGGSPAARGVDDHHRLASVVTNAKVVGDDAIL